MNRMIFSSVIVLLFIYIASPLVLPVAMGAVFAVLLFPWLQSLEKTRLSTRWGAAVLTVGITLGFLLPAALLIFLAAKTGLQQLKALKDAPQDPEGGFFSSILNSPGIQRVIEQISNWFPLSIQDLAYALEDLASAAGVKITELLGNLFTQLPSLSMGLVVMVLSIYFFLADGRTVVAFVRKNPVMGRQQTERIIHKFAVMCRSVVLATVISGFVQAVIFLFSCLAVGVPHATLIGFIVFLASFVPLVGSFPVTVTVAIQQLFLGNRTAGIVLLVMAVAVSLVDNLIRPWVLKGASNLHPLLAFVAAFGGLQMLGVSGIFLGPIVAGLLVVILKNYIQGESA